MWKLNTVLKFGSLFTEMEEQSEETVSKETISEGTLSDEEFDLNQFADEDDGNEWDLVSQISETSALTDLSSNSSSV